MKLHELLPSCLGYGLHFIGRPAFPTELLLRVVRIPSMKPILPSMYIPTGNPNYPMATFEVWMGKDIVCYGWIPSLEDLSADDWVLVERRE